jgi:hypothetical protein
MPAGGRRSEKQRVGFGVGQFCRGLVPCFGVGVALALDEDAPVRGGEVEFVDLPVR